MKILITLLAIFSFNAYALPVDINKADAKTISQSLKGIGEKTIKKNKAGIRFSKVKTKTKTKTKANKKAKKKNTKTLEI